MGIKALFGRKEQQKYQEMFINKDINALSCSTTFEMGVDVGDLETVSNFPFHSLCIISAFSLFVMTVSFLVFFECFSVLFWIEILGFLILYIRLFLRLLKYIPSGAFPQWKKNKKISF